MRAAELRVVTVMVIVRTSPNTAGAQDQDSKDSHQPFGQPGMRQYRLMLLIVINHEKPKIKKPGEKTADYPADEMEVPQSPRHGAGQKRRCGENIPPTPGPGINRVRFGSQYDLFSRSHAGSNFFENGPKPFCCP